MTIIPAIAIISGGILAGLVVGLTLIWAARHSARPAHKENVAKSKSKTQYVVIHDGCGGVVGELEGGGGIQWLCTKCDKRWEFFEDRTDVWLFTPKRQITGSIVGDTAVGQGHAHGPGWGGVRMRDGSVGF